MCMPVPKTKKKVLIVEDDTVIGLMLQELLMPDYEVFVALDGTEAVSLARSEKFDLLLTDLNLPDIDGFEVARKIRGITRDIKTVLHTASTLSFALAPPHIDVVVDKSIGASKLLSLLASLLNDGYAATASHEVPV